MGMVTCIGGGLMRDVILRDIPFILRKYIYAVATIIGSSLYYVIATSSISDDVLRKTVATTACTLIVFIIRMVATAFKLNLPKAIRFSEIREEQTEDSASVK